MNAKSHPAVPYARKPKEQAVIDAWSVQNKERLPRPRLVVQPKGKGRQIALDHPDQGTAQILAMKAVGTTSADFYNGLASQLVNVASKGQEPNLDAANFMLSVVSSIEPRDEIEAMLAAQMAAVHLASMTFARRLAHIETIPQQDSAERTFNKLTRTFATQMEALKRYRTGGEQKMTIEHVTVEKGGQAIIGNVQPPGRGILLEKDEPTS